MHGSGSRERKNFFFEKKKQKTFVSLVRAVQRYARGNKSFLVLFFKKEHSSFSK
jgi:hypothetical protein